MLANSNTNPYNLHYPYIYLFFIDECNAYPESVWIIGTKGNQQGCAAVCAASGIANINKALEAVFDFHDR